MDQVKQHYAGQESTCVSTIDQKTLASCDCSAAVNQGLIATSMKASRHINNLPAVYLRVTRYNRRWRPWLAEKYPK